MGATHRWPLHSLCSEPQAAAGWVERPTTCRAAPSRSARQPPGLQLGLDIYGFISTHAMYCSVVHMILPCFPMQHQTMPGFLHQLQQ